MEAQSCRKSQATLTISLGSQSSSVSRIVCGPSNISSEPFSAQARCADCQFLLCIGGPVCDYRLLRESSDLKGYLESLETLEVAVASPRPSHLSFEPQFTESHSLWANGSNAIELSDFSSHRFRP